jgi:3-phosphoshikimate 1-carboxyvinyltransferase
MIHFLPMTQIVLNAKNAKKRHEISDIPGDKSISHRAIILGSLANNESTFHNFLMSEDCLNTVKIFQQLDVPITIDKEKKTVHISGQGLHGLKQSRSQLDVGNSGTGIRLITGILAAQNFPTVISGDHSIEKRPMKRIITPLSEMGAQITGQSLDGKSDIYPPLNITPSKITPMHYTLPVASAQVKSALLFASLFSQEPSTIIEPETCRNHTEIMLKNFGADIQVSGHEITCSGKNELSNPYTQPIVIPSDFSSAAFFIVLACLIPNSHWTIKHVGMNPTRATLIDILQKMGANISLTNKNLQDMEPYADIEVKGSDLHNIEVPIKSIPFIIDEIPVLAVAGMFASGTLLIKNAEELRVKESDRIETTKQLIEAFGGSITEFEDGFSLIGQSSNSTEDVEIQSHGDHRIAMSGIVGALASKRNITVHNTNCIQTSFPNFEDLINQAIEEAITS